MTSPDSGDACVGNVHGSLPPTVLRHTLPSGGQNTLFHAFDTQKTSWVPGSGLDWMSASCSHLCAFDTLPYPSALHNPPGWILLDALGTQNRCSCFHGSVNPLARSRNLNGTPFLSHGCILPSSGTPSFHETRNCDPREVASFHTPQKPLCPSHDLGSLPLSISGMGGNLHLHSSLPCYSSIGSSRPCILHPHLDSLHGNTL